MMLDQAQCEVLEARLKTLLPEEYRERYEEVLPVSMGSAGLRFGSDGRVAWDEMWKSFCDLAMAGGPPHKGTLLEPGAGFEIARYRQVIDEICRGITMVTGLGAEASPVRGWVRVSGMNHAMAGWMLRAITMENVSVRSREGGTLDLPAGSGFRLEKETKNVVTVMAKTCHYWTGHVEPEHQRVIGRLLESMDAESPLIQPDGGWSGLECADVRGAVWRMRMLVASNVLARREGTTVLVPAGAMEALEVVQVLAAVRGIL
jgi:sirohydrochlorin cobaltochelatase